VDRRRERLAKIINTLKVGNAASIRELADGLDVSPMTVRRDLSVLEGENVVKLMHGAVVLNPGSRLAQGGGRYSLAGEGARMAEEKRRIGMRAASMIGEGETVVIDAGSTTEYLARSLPDGLRTTVLCYAMNILVEIYRKRECRLIFAGGYFHENTLMFESAEGVELIRQNRAAKAFVSASGISERLGVTCGNPYEVETKKAVMASSLKRILTADSSKLGKVHAAYFADLADFDTLVTDVGISEQYAQVLRSLDIEVIVV
jgi:DeoR family deoxyribose operon repressor